MPVMLVPRSSATVAIETFITELSSIIRNCPAHSVSRMSPAPTLALRSIPRIFAAGRSSRQHFCQPAGNFPPPESPRGERRGRARAWDPVGDERGQGTVEWVGLVGLMALALVGVLAAGVRVPGTDLARSVAQRILCAAELADGCG